MFDLLLAATPLVSQMVRIDSYPKTMPPEAVDSRLVRSIAHLRSVIQIHKRPGMTDTVLANPGVHTPLDTFQVGDCPENMTHLSADIVNLRAV